MKTTDLNWTGQGLPLGLAPIGNGQWPGDLLRMALLLTLEQEWWPLPHFRHSARVRPNRVGKDLACAKEECGTQCQQERVPFPLALPSQLSTVIAETFQLYPLSDQATAQEKRLPRTTYVYQCAPGLGTFLNRLRQALLGWHLGVQC